MRKQVYVKRRANARSLFLFLICITLLTSLLIRMDRSIRPKLCAITESETKAYASKLLATSVAQILEENSYCYSDFAALIYDTNGNIAAVETLSENINQIQVALLDGVQKQLDTCRDATLSVSLGTTTDIWLFADKGPQISVNLMPIGAATVQLISALESTGINQACHTISAQITAEIRAAIPFSEVSVTVDFQYLIAETVIVGNVPDSYLTFG